VPAPRLELDHLRRRFGGERGAQARRQSQGARGQRSRSVGSDSGSRTGRWDRGTDRAASFAEIAASQAATPALLSVSDSVGPPQPTYPNGTHIAEVEIDPETGHTRIIDYVVVDDFGVTINPLLLAGQVRSGAVRASAGRSPEHRLSRDSGQLVTSLMDYALPRAEDAPSFAFETRSARDARPIPWA
jgi:CO/xanthine dehydrogenase Mo-binding subunit